MRFEIRMYRKRKIKYKSNETNTVTRHNTEHFFVADLFENCLGLVSMCLCGICFMKLNFLNLKSNQNHTATYLFCIDRFDADGLTLNSKPSERNRKHSSTHFYSVAVCIIFQISLSLLISGDIIGTWNLCIIFVYFCYFKLIFWRWKRIRQGQV